MWDTGHPLKLPDIDQIPGRGVEKSVSTASTCQAVALDGEGLNPLTKGVQIPQLAGAGEREHSWFL